jgi:hypothetical protein
VVNPNTDPNRPGRQAHQRADRAAQDWSRKNARLNADIARRNADLNSGLSTRPAGNRGARFIGLIIFALILFVVWKSFG